MPRPICTSGLCAGKLLVRTRARARRGLHPTRPPTRKSTPRRSKTALAPAKASLRRLGAGPNLQPGPKISPRAPRFGHRLPLSRKMQSA